MTDTSRRSLLRAGIFGTFLAVLVPAGYAVATTAADLYSRTRFKSQLNRVFTLSNETRNWSVTLVAVTDIQGAPKGAANAFGLTFRSSSTAPPQGTYTLRRSGFAATRLFVVPGDAAQHALLAVVNRTV